MTKRVLVCSNLIGDSLYLLRSVKLYLDQNDDVAAILVLRGIAGELFIRSFSERVPVMHDDTEIRTKWPEAEWIYLQAGLAAQIAYAYANKHKRMLHIAEGYSLLLGVDIEGKIEPIHDWEYFPDQRIEQDPKVAVISPFSQSCTRHAKHVKIPPNKTLDDWKWEPLIQMLRRHGYLVKVTGARGDRLKRCSIPESDYTRAFTLKDLELELRQASLLVSIDNGIAHLGAAVRTPTILFWPKVSDIDFISPAWSETTRILHIGRPHEVPPAALLVGLRKMMAHLESTNEQAQTSPSSQKSS